MYPSLYYQNKPFINEYLFLSNQILLLIIQNFTIMT